MDDAPDKKGIPRPGVPRPGVPRQGVPRQGVPRQGVPRHVAMIMDGNRRWAQARGLPSGQGHERGVSALREIVRAANKIPIEFLTFYGFSTNNWRRSDDEVQNLMKLLRSYLRSDLAELHENNVRLRILGRRANLEADILALVDEAEALTKGNQGMSLAIAFNYGARDEIARAAQKIARAARGQLDPDAITMDTIAAALDTHDMPPVDLVIRTGGEQRLSDFLLWQSAYAELVFTETFWPDFTPQLFMQALDDYLERSRRFGADAVLSDKKAVY